MYIHLCLPYVSNKRNKSSNCQLGKSNKGTIKQRYVLCIKLDQVGIDRLICIASLWVGGGWTTWGRCLWRLRVCQCKWQLHRQIATNKVSVVYFQLAGQVDFLVVLLQLLLHFQNRLSSTEYHVNVKTTMYNTQNLLSFDYPLYKWEGKHFEILHCTSVNLPRSESQYKTHFDTILHNDSKVFLFLWICDSANNFK